MSMAPHWSARRNIYCFRTFLGLREHQESVAKTPETHCTTRVTALEKRLSTPALLIAVITTS